MVFAADVARDVVAYGVAIGRSGEIIQWSVQILERWVLLMRGVSICLTHFLRPMINALRTTYRNVGRYRYKL